jgi:hypothetical protein
MFRGNDPKIFPELYKKANEKGFWLIPHIDLSQITQEEFINSIQLAKDKHILCDWEYVVLEHLIDHLFQQEESDGR